MLNMDNSSEENLFRDIMNEKEYLRQNEYNENNCGNVSSGLNVKTSKRCLYFSKNGYCKFGSSCKYSHRKLPEDMKELTLSTVPKDAYNHQSSDIANSFNEIQCSNQQTSRAVCRYFLIGHCFKGDNCKYTHSFNLCEKEIDASYLSLSGKFANKITTANNRSYKNKISPCYYFKKGNCYKGDECKYYHNKKYFSSIEGASNLSEKSVINSSLSDGNSYTVPSKLNSSPEKPILNQSFNVYERSSLITNDMPLLRTTEINQLKKRFPHHVVITENENFLIIFQPSDPDWPFDVKSLKIEVNFPKDYPVQKCTITVIRDAECIPDLLIKHLNKAICNWIDKKYEDNSRSNALELVFRPFLKWFDKNLEDLFIIGLRKVKQDMKAKEDGIEFVPVENLFPLNEKNHICDEYSKEAMENPMPLPNQSILLNTNNLLPVKDSNKSFYYVGNDSIKVLFSGLELIEGIAALICTKISVTLQCCRCKTSFNMKSVPEKNNCQICSKCNKNLAFIFEHSTLHQFSNILGNLHLLDCVVVDINLVECHFLVDCLNCSKQVPVEGIHYGQKHKMWCIYCNEKMLISIGCVKFQSFKFSSVTGFKASEIKKISKKVKDPIIKEGEPLPNFGACKHYKKSYRWLRFPCCGRLYPCDECHNEKETDHEMKYASRMVCGFCAKEQQYSKEKPCFACSQNLTKKSGSHWEGGKGCRNKIQMSREDKQKYSGSSKTISKRAQNIKSKKRN